MCLNETYNCKAEKQFCMRNHFSCYRKFFYSVVFSLFFFHVVDYIVSFRKILKSPNLKNFEITIRFIKIPS